MSDTTNLQLPYIDANQNQKSVTHNDALTRLDVLVNTAVQGAALAAPPVSPADGQCWLVAAGATGAFAGKDSAIAAWQDGAWAFYFPNRGTLVFNAVGQRFLVWSGTAWVALAATFANLTLAELGIGTAPDAGNPLSATLNAALFNALPAAGGGTGDVRLKLNKQGTGNTASILFQDAFSGRAEIGLCGDDGVHVRVSPDGVSFRDALVLTPAGAAVFQPGLGTTLTPGSSGALVFETTSDTSVTVKLKGSDGVVRAAVLTLA